MATKSKEDILAAAKAKIAAKSVQATGAARANPAPPPTVFEPVAAFWCAHASHTVYLSGSKEVKFSANRAYVKTADEVRQLRELCKAYPHKFKELE